MLETTPENGLSLWSPQARPKISRDRCPTDETMNPKTAVGKSGLEVHRLTPDTELGADTENLKQNLILDPNQELDAEYSTRNRTKAGRWSRSTRAEETATEKSKKGKELACRIHRRRKPEE
jgi:hypothetical protein